MSDQLMYYLLGLATLPALAVILAGGYLVAEMFYRQREEMIAEAESVARWNARVVAERDEAIERLVTQLMELMEVNDEISKNAKGKAGPVDTQMGN